MSKTVKRRKGTLIILSVSLLLISSLAFFTDRVTNKSVGLMGDLAIYTSLSPRDDLSNLAAGDQVGMDLEVINQGSLDGVIRTTYQIAVDKSIVDDFSLGDVTLNVNGNKVVDTINTEYRYYEESLQAGFATDYELDLIISNGVKNVLQDKGFKVLVLTEIKQDNSPDWIELAVDEIKFGANEDFKVVPSNNLIRSSEFNIRRTSAEDFDTTGYVSAFIRGSSAYTVDEFTNQFLNQNNFLHLYSEDGVELTGDDSVIPGSIIQLEVDGVVLDRLTVILMGDMNGDGRMQSIDYALVMNVRDIQMGVLGKRLNVTSFHEIAGDIDGDGIVSQIDVDFIKGYVTGSITSFPDFYPSKPKLKHKPNLSIGFGDNDNLDFFAPVEDLDYRGNTLRRGSRVKPGQVIKVAIDVDNLRGLDLHSLAANLEIDTDYVEFASFDNQGSRTDFWNNYKGCDSVAPTEPRGDYCSSYWGLRSAAYDRNHHMVNVDGIRTHELDALTGPGQYIIFAVRVKEDAPSGTRLNFNLKNINFTHEAYGGLKFYDFVDSAVNSYLIVE